MIGILKRFFEKHFTTNLHNDILYKYFSFKNNGQGLMDLQLKGKIFDFEKEAKGFLQSGGSRGIALQKGWRRDFESSKQIYMFIEECEHIRSGPAILIIPAQNLKMEETEWKPITKID